MTTENMNNDISELENEMLAINNVVENNVIESANKRAATLATSKERAKHYTARSMDFGKNGRYTVVREVFANDVPDGFKTAYVTQFAIVNEVTGKIEYKPTGLFMVGIRADNAMVILTSTGKRPTSWDIDKREMSFNIVEKAQRLTHLFGTSHRAAYAETVKNRETTRKPSGN